MSQRTLLGITHSTCPVCRELVPTKILGIDGDVYFDKFCSVHGNNLVFIRADTDDYLRTLHYVKPATTPFISRGDENLSCPTGCGFCSRHEQHLCLPIIEITHSCDLSCPVCMVDASGDGTLTVDEFSFILDRLLEGEPKIDVLNLSGGEPLTHPDLLAIIDNAYKRPNIIRVSISTNGLRLLHDKTLLAELKARNVVVSLQFDGFEDEIYKTLRGRPLFNEKRSILDLLCSSDITTSLTMTLARNINEDALSPVLDMLFETPNIASLMIQPITYEGRGHNLERPSKRLSIPEIVKSLERSGKVKASDFIPLPCSHPACFTLAFYLMLDNGGHISLSELSDAATRLDIIANRAIFGLDENEHERIKSMVYELWSGPAASNPESQSVLKTVKSLFLEINKISGTSFDPKLAFEVGERKIKSIFIHAFQDVDTFDLARARRCCNGYPQKDGRVIPACVRNVLRRNKSRC